MRLYRFIDTDKKIDTVVVTDGSCDQKRVFITEIRGIVTPGDVSVTEDEVSGSDALLKLGFPWKVGESVMHEELVAFAENKALTLELNPQGLNEVVAVTAEWNDENACVITIKTTIPAPKDVDIYFPNDVNLNESAGRFGVIRGDRKTLTAKIMSGKPMEFTLEDLGLDAKEDLNVVIMANDGVVTVTQAGSVITYEEVLTVSPQSLEFTAMGGTKDIDVVSRRNKLVNGNPSGEYEELPTDIELTGMGFSYLTNSAAVYEIIAEENTAETQRTATATISQTKENGKSVTVNITQVAADVTYEYTCTVDPTTLSFAAAGETKIFEVTATKQKKVNGSNSGIPSAVTYTTTVQGEGFTKGSSEYSVVAAANTGAQRTGTAVVTTTEGNKTATVTLTQLADNGKKK